MVNCVYWAKSGSGQQYSVSTTLACLHEAGIVWGDAKAANILVDMDDNAWICYNPALLVTFVVLVYVTRPSKWCARAWYLVVLSCCPVSNRR